MSAPRNLDKAIQNLRAAKAAMSRTAEDLAHARPPDDARPPSPPAAPKPSPRRLP